MSEFTVKTSDFVNLLISNSTKPEFSVERRFQKSLTILEFKMKLELVTGGSAQTMRLELYDTENKLVCEITDNDAMLGAFALHDGMRVHVVDKFLMLYEFAESANIEKYNISEEEYNRKPDTVRSFLQKNKLGKYNEEKMKELKMQQQEEEMEERRLASLIPVGARCEVHVPSQPCRRATVKYNGSLEIAGKGGMWIGVQYDEPLGKNDGCVEGKRYFTCPPNYGGFIKPVYITVGDYPVQDFLEDEI